MGSFAHTVAVFEEDGYYNIIDGTQVFRFKAKDLKQLASKVYPFWKKSAIVARSGATHRGKIMKQFDRQMRAYTQVSAAA